MALAKGVKMSKGSGAFTPNPKYRRRARKDHKKLMVLAQQVGNPEVKRTGYWQANLASATTMAIFNPIVPVLGNTNTTRIGSKIRVVGFEFAYFLNTTSTTTYPISRLQVVKYRRMNNAAAPFGQAQIYYDNTGGLQTITGPLQPDETNKPGWVPGEKRNKEPSFSVYYDRTHRLGPTDHTATQTYTSPLNSTKRFMKRMRFSKPWAVTFTANAGAITDIVDNWLFVCYIGDANTTNLNAYITLFYIE